MHPKVGGLDFGGGCRARGVVVKAAGIAKVVVAEEVVGQRDLSGRGSGG